MKVHVVSIEHRHGTNITVHVTSQGALDQRDQYADENWDSEFPDEDKPAENIGDAYFDKIEDEFCNIEEIEVQS
jgi:hypothetical protein